VVRARAKASFPAMEELKKKYSSQGLTIVAVSVDEKPEEHAAGFSNPPKSPFTVVRDAQHKLVAAADVKGMPTSFLIDRSGKIRLSIRFRPRRNPASIRKRD